MPYVICKERDENMRICGESSDSSLKIIKEFKKMYEDRLNSIEREAGCGDGTQLKLKTMQSWIKDLENQNACLVKVVEQLEHELESRSKVPTPKMIEAPEKKKELEEEVEKLKRNVNDLKADKERLKNILDETNCSIKDLEFREYDSKIKLETLRSNLNSKEQVAVNLEEMVKILQVSLTMAQKEKEDIEKKLTKSTENKRDLEEVQNKVKSLQEENKELRAEKAELLKTIKEQEKDRRIVCPKKPPRGYDRSSVEESDYEESGSESQRTRASSAGDWHINELVGLVDAQNEKIIFCEDNITKLRTTYNAVAERNKTLEGEMDILKQELENYRHTDDSEARILASQEEANNCLSTMDSLQENVSALKGLLKEKTDNLNLLQAENETLQNELADIKLDYKELEERSRRELNSLRKDVDNLEERLNACECENQHLIDDEKKHQKMLLEAANRELRIQQEFTQREKELMDKIQNAQNENFRLSDIVDFLNEELQNMKCEVAERDAQLRAISSQHRNSIKTIEKLQAENEYYERIKTKLKNSYCLVIKHNKALMKELQTFKQKINAYLVQTESSEKYNLISHAEVNTCKNLLCSLQEKVAVLKDMLHNKLQELSETQCNNEDLQNELKIVKQRCSELQIAEVNEEKCRKHIERWKYKIANMDNCCKALQRRNEALEKEMESLRETLEEYKQHIDKSDERALAYQEEMFTCKNTFQCMQKKLVILQKLVKEKTVSLVKVNEELQAEKQKNNDDTLEKRNLELIKEINTLKMTLEDYKKQVNKSQECVSTSQKEIDICKTTLNSIEDKVFILQKILKDKCEDLGKVEAKNNDWSKNQMENISLMADKSEKRIALVQIEADTCRSILNSVQEKVATIKNLLSEKCEELTKALDEKEASQKELDDLKEKCKNVSAAATEEKNLKQELETKTELIENLQINLNEVNAQLIVALRRLEEREARKQNLKAQVIKLKERLQTCETQQSETDTLKDEVTCLKAEIRHLTKLQEKANSENSSLQAELQKLRDSQTMSDKEESKLQNKLLKLEKQRENLETELKCIMDYIGKLEEICDYADHLLSDHVTEDVEVVACSNEVCNDSFKIITKAYTWIKDLCEIYKNLNNSLDDNDNVIKNLQQKEKKQSEMLKKANRKICALWRSLKASEKREVEMRNQLYPESGQKSQMDLYQSEYCEIEEVQVYNDVSLQNNDNMTTPEIEICYMNPAEWEEQTTYYSSSA